MILEKKFAQQCRASWQVIHSIRLCCLVPCWFTEGNAQRVARRVMATVKNVIVLRCKQADRSRIISGYLNGWQGRQSEQGERQDNTLCDLCQKTHFRMRIQAELTG